MKYDLRNLEPHADRKYLLGNRTSSALLCISYKITFRNTYSCLLSFVLAISMFRTWCISNGENMMLFVHFEKMYEIQESEFKIPLRIFDLIPLFKNRLSAQSMLQTVDYCSLLIDPFLFFLFLVFYLCQDSTSMVLVYFQSLLLSWSQYPPSVSRFLCCSLLFVCTTFASFVGLFMRRSCFYCYFILLSVLQVKQNWRLLTATAVACSAWSSTGLCSDRWLVTAKSSCLLNV